MIIGITRVLVEDFRQKLIAISKEIWSDQINVNLNSFTINWFKVVQFSLNNKNEYFIKVCVSYEREINAEEFSKVLLWIVNEVLNGKACTSWL